MQHVQELEGLHLEPEAAVDHEKNQVRNLAQIDHRRDVVGTLDERQTPVLSADDRDGAAYVGQCLLRVLLDERLLLTNDDNTHFNQRRLADLGRTHHDDHHRRVCTGRSVRQRSVDLLEAAIEITLNGTLRADRRIHGKGLRLKDTHYDLLRDACSLAAARFHSSCSSSLSFCSPCFRHEEHDVLFASVQYPYF